MKRRFTDNELRIIFVIIGMASLTALGFIRAAGFNIGSMLCSGCK